METFDLTTTVSKRALVVPYQPNAVDDKYVSDGKAFMVMKAAFWAHFLYNEMRIVFTKDVPISATDAHSIFINIDGMRKHDFGFAEICFVLAHEVLHRVLCDLILMAKFEADGFVMTPIGKLPYDAQLMNIAEDYRINAILIASKIGKMPKIGFYDPNISKEGMESAIEIYAKLWQQGKRGSGQGGNQPSGFDIHLKPGQGTVEAQKSGQINQAIAAAAQAAQAAGQGNLPAALGALIGEILDPHVPWQEYLKATMLRKGGDPVYDWRFLDKRLLSRPDRMIFARQGHTGAGQVVIGYDTSGSCVNEQYQRRFFSEMAGIVADLNPSELIVVWCDAAVQRVDEIEEPEDLEELRMEINALGGAPGGGGTNFIPVFEEIEKRGLQPDMLVYLSDLYGTFPDHEPDYPVIWACVSNATPPWGDLVKVDL